jgi:hypothetical protein
MVNVIKSVAMHNFLIATVPVVNLRREPVDGVLQHIHDELQETQILYNEAILYRSENRDWYYAEAIEQKKFIMNNAWKGYPGWVRKGSVIHTAAQPECNVVVKSKAANILEYPDKKGKTILTVPIGTRLRIKEQKRPRNNYWLVQLPDGRDSWILKDDIHNINGIVSEERLRRNIAQTAKLFLGVPYLWGGRSIYLPELKDIATGVDCSGFVNLVYRTNGIDVPRDAHDQWLVAKKINVENLKEGDLIFLSMEEQHDSINHVMIYMGKEEFIEASETGDRKSVV